MKLKPRNPGSDWCIVSGCRSQADVLLSADTFLGRRVGLVPNTDIGLCEEHWEKHCLEEEKLYPEPLDDLYAEKVIPACEVDATIVEANTMVVRVRVRTPVPTRSRKRTPVPKR